MLTGTSLLPLQRADGSATYSAHGFSVLAAVNGPVEVQRRDELPEEATVDVVVRPAAGVGSMTAPFLYCHRFRLTAARCPGTPARVDPLQNSTPYHTCLCTSTKVDTGYFTGH